MKLKHKYRTLAIDVAWMACASYTVLMPIVKDHAQILKVYEHSNTSLIMVMLCRHFGQVRVLAKGARRVHKKGFEGGFDLLVRGEIVLYSRPDDQLWIFKEWDERQRPIPIETTFQHLQIASYLCEFTEAITRETTGSTFLDQEDKEYTHGRLQAESESEAGMLFDLLQLATEMLSSGASNATIALWYTLNVLETTGHLPEFSACSNCGKTFEANTSRNFAILSPKGLECADCIAKLTAQMQESNVPADNFPTYHLRNATRISPETLGALAFIKRTGKSVHLSKQAAAGAARALTVLVHGALEHDLKTLSATTAFI